MLVQQAMLALWLFGFDFWNHVRFPKLHPISFLDTEPGVSAKCCWIYSSPAPNKSPTKATKPQTKTSEIEEKGKGKKSLTVKRSSR